MTQPKKAFDKKAKNPEKGKTLKRFASTLPAQTLCWLGSFSLLGSGFVLAQMENSGIDNIVPTSDNSPQSTTTNTNSSKQQTLVIDGERPKPDFSERRARLRQRLKSNSRTAEKQTISKSETKPQAKVKTSQPVVTISQSKSKPESKVQTSQIKTSQVKTSQVKTSQPVVRISKSKPKSKVKSSQPVVIISQAKSTPAAKIDTSQNSTENTVSIKKPQVENTQAVIELKVPPRINEETLQPANNPVNNNITENVQGNNAIPEKNQEVGTPEQDSKYSKYGDDVVRNMGKDQENDQSSYIDPTDYNNLATGTYQSPNSLEITENSSGCQQSLAVGGNVGTGCAQTFENPHINNNTNTANTANSRKTANTAHGGKNSSPTWLKKSATAKLPTVTPAPRLIRENNSVNNQEETNENENKTVAQVIARGMNRISRGTLGNARVGNNSHNKSSYQAGNYIPSPQEFSASTKVSDTPIAPRVGSLPSPMTEDRVAPRLSQVSYDFALAAVLPQVSYTNTIAYRSGHGMLFPLAVPAPITSLFGWRIHPITGDRRFHAGTDIGAPTGTPVIAAARGQIESANWMGGYGLAVTINHTSAQQTLYGHLSEILVQPGQWVEPGTVIGRVGSTGNSTGPHLHFEVRHLTQNGWVAVDPAVRVPTSISREVKPPSSISQVVQSLPPVRN